MTSTGSSSANSSSSAGGPYHVSGQLVGDAGVGVVIALNGSEQLTLGAAGAFAFTTDLASGATYDVTVVARPPNVACTLQGGSGAVSGADVTAVVITCVPSFGLYASGEGWNDWLVNDGADSLSATGTACTRTLAGTGWDPCFHAGEIRALELRDVPDCVGVMLTDALDAFTWTCDDTGGTVRAISKGLKDGRYLSHLLNFTAPVGWKANSVTALRGADAYPSTPAAWWPNPVVAQFASGNLSQAGTIYVVTEDLAASFNLSADRVGLVIAPGFTLLGRGDTTDPCVETTTSAARAFLWVEGDIDATGDKAALSLPMTSFSVVRGLTTLGGESGDTVYFPTDNGLFVDAALTGSRQGSLWLDGSFGRVRNVTVTESGVSSTGGDAGIYLGANFDDNDVADIWVLRTEGNGIHVGTSSCCAERNVFRRIRVLQAGGNGISISHMRHNVFDDVVVADSGVRTPSTAAGITFGSYVYANVFHRVRSTSNGGAALYRNGYNLVFLDSVLTGSDYEGAGDERGVHAPDGSVFIATTIAHHTGGGVDVEQLMDRMVFMATAIVANGVGESGGISSTGLYLQGDDNRFIDTAITDSETQDVYASQFASNDQFEGILLLTNQATSCYVSSLAISPGITGTCTGAAGTVTFGSAAGSFVGAVSTDDVANASDTNGVGTWAAITDWASFDNTFRVWEAAGATMTSGYGNCRLTGSCRIWDWSLSASDDKLRDVLALPTASDVIVKQWNIGTTQTAAQCTQFSPGGVWNTIYARCESTFLNHAMEVLLDGIGNDNGLCESNETCTVTPNIGAYQGHGTLVQVGTIGAGGAVENVTLLGWDQNGR